MLISDKHKFLFLHIPKSAGQSVVNALMPWAARPYQKMLSHVVPWRWQLKANSALKRYFRISLPPQPWPDHFRVWQLVEQMGIEAFQEYYSFTFVRNPWDRLLSTYTYTLSNKRHGRHKMLQRFSDFNDYVSWHCTEDTYGFQRDYVYAKDGTRLTSFVGKFENLNADFETVCQSVGIDATLPKFNVSNMLNYREVYTPKSKDLVYGIYRADIDTFGYTF